MIRSFRNRETEKVFGRQFSRRLAQSIQKTARRKLVILNNAYSLEDLRAVPGNHLEALAGNREGQHSIKINDQWRICFVWAGDPYEVEIVDYHK